MAPSGSAPMDPGPCRWELPDPLGAEPFADVIGVGADLTPATVIQAYRMGLFPMHLPTGELGWWSPDPRGVLPLDALRVTRSLRKSMSRFTTSIDAAFIEVMEACREDRPDRWITDDFIDSYTHLHRMGWVHSVEVWNREGKLVGGLYGIEVRGLFAGESMFYRESDASKVALVALVQAMRAAAGPRLLDVQWRTDHLGSMGVVEVRRPQYLQLLSAALASSPALGPGPRPAEAP